MKENRSLRLYQRHRVAAKIGKFAWRSALWRKIVGIAVSGKIYNFLWKVLSEICIDTAKFSLNFAVKNKAV
ncbi:MAG: hypothetical protein LIP23_03115 [Planctomycetes bacterium]|nr:hypothetical protein [Planctomycetota bacterium]